MTLGPLLRVGHSVRYTPRNRADHEWPTHWAELMLKRGVITRTLMTRHGQTKVAVMWGARSTAQIVDPDLLDYVVAEGNSTVIVGRRVRRLPSKEVGKTSVMCDWAGSIGVIATPLKDAYVTVQWPGGIEQRHSIFAIEDA